jgi:arabinogalactan oligomer/maltooligosaccharide transport system permease protein
VSPRLAALSAVAALVWSAPATAQPEREVTLWHAYGEAEAPGLHAAIAAFRRRNPDVRVRVVHNAFGAYRSKLESAIPTGHGPDVFIDAHERLQAYHALGLVEPVDGLDFRTRVDFDEDHLAALSVGGEVYALPLALKCAALYVNTTLSPEPPRTLADVEALAGRTPEGTYPLVFEAESSYYDSALIHADGTWAFAGPAAEATLARLARMTADGVVPEEPNGDLVRQLFSSGRAVTAISGPWLEPELGEVPYRVVPLPELGAGDRRRMRPFVTVEGAMLARDAERPMLANALIRFLAGPEGARLRAEHGRQIVASRTVWEGGELDDPFLTTFRRAAAMGVIMPTHPHMQAAFEPAEKAIRKVLRNGVDAASALEEGGRRFEDAVRPPPAPRDPTMGVLGVGLLVLLVSIVAVRRAKDAAVRESLRASLPAYAWVAHAALAVGLLVMLPLVVGAAASFFAGRGWDMHYVGLANYADILTARGRGLFDNGSFWLVTLVTVLWTVSNVALHVVIGVALAVVLHRPAMKLKAAYRVLLILPWAVPSYVTALSWKGMFHRQFGAVNAILEAIGAEPVSWFGHFSTAFAANVSTNVWLGFPFMMVVTLGALSAIPRDLYEAAAVDGATAWQRFKLITLPMLRPMLAPAVAMGAVWTFNMFNVVFLVSGGEPDGSTEILVSEAYRWAFTRSSQYGYAAAYAVLIFGILVLGTRRWAGRLEGMGETS